MANKNILFTNTFYRVIKTVHYLTQADGTTVKELSRELHLTRRSIFRLLNTIEHTLKITVEVRREIFGGVATYRIPSTFIENISLPNFTATTLSFNQAIILYILFSNDYFTDSTCKK